MKSISLGALCLFQNGRAFKPTEWSDTGTPIIRIQNLNDPTKPFNYHRGEVDKKFHVNDGDLLFSWSGTPGTSFGAFFWNRGFAFLNQHIFRVNVNSSNCDKNYLKYALNTKLNEIIGLSHGGVGLKHITKGTLEAVTIPLPSLAEQKRIADILDKADTLREKRKQAIEKLDGLLQSVFLDMFGDPVTNPKRWDIKTIEEVTTKVTDGTHKTPRYTESGIEFLSAKDIKAGKIIWNSGKYISISEHHQLVRRCNPEKGDLLLAKSGSLGDAAIIDKDHEFSLFESLCLIKYDREQVNAEYLHSALRSVSLQQELLKSNKGIAIKHLHLIDIKKLRLPIPPSHFQEEWKIKTIQINALLNKQRREYEVMNSLFSSLQQRAFRGDL